MTTWPRLSVAAMLGFFLGGASVTLADQPLERPESHKIRSPLPGCWANTDVATRTTTAYKRVGKRTMTMWRMEGWYRVAGLAADCEHFVTGFDGVNLLPDPFDPETVMLSFFRKGVLIRKVTLRELVKDLSKLEKTMSHWSWGYYVGVEKRTRFRVRTVDRGEIVFDMTTGLPVS